MECDGDLLQCCTELLENVCDFPIYDLCHVLVCWFQWSTLKRNVNHLILAELACCCVVLSSTDGTNLEPALYSPELQWCRPMRQRCFLCIYTHTHRGRCTYKHSETALGRSVVMSEQTVEMIIQTNTETNHIKLSCYCLLVESINSL